MLCKELEHGLACSRGLGRGLTQEDATCRPGESSRSPTAGIAIFFFFFFSNLSTQPKIERHTFHQLVHPGASRRVLLLDVSVLCTPQEDLRAPIS